VHARGPFTFLNKHGVFGTMCSEMYMKL
jgi:hypothetical protein